MSIDQKDQKLCDEHGQPRSPLDKIQNLETVAPEKVQEVEGHLEKVVSTVRQRIMEDHKRAVILRRTVIGKIRV